MPVVESNEEMKKNMRRIKKEETSKKMEADSSSEDTGAKQEISAKIDEVKDNASDKKENIQRKADETKRKLVKKVDETKEDVSNKKDEINLKLEDVKDTAGEKKDEVKQGLEDTIDEAEKQKQKLEKESEKQDMSPAEKILNDIVTRFRQGSDQINEAIVDRSEESKSSKKDIMKKPLIDVLETNDTIYIVADISGIKKDDIELGISKNRVDITATFKAEPEIEDTKFIQKERNYGKTHRKIMLSTDVKVKETKAKFKDCTLTITLPKKVEDMTKIEIEG
ncbi:MAG: Hsp20 family protein [Methanobacterium sp.]|nr:Hsp20 family protein [Methanobacterium sp.]